MSPGSVPVAVLLLLATGFVLQLSAAEDIYWEGEDDAKNEYLEVKEDGIAATLRRVRRQWDLFSFFDNDKKQKETNENDGHIDEDNTVDAEDDFNANVGSGAAPEKEPDFREKTLRVSFVVMEPYTLQYSNRDSEQFRNLSKSLADSVNVLFEQLPGTQRATLVRIQSRTSDQFSCKVTLDISTIGYDNIAQITNILRTHIRDQMKLGSVTVSDTDFSATPIDPDLVSPECAPNEFLCTDSSCVPAYYRCNGASDCNDGSDEWGCPNIDLPDPTTTQLPERNLIDPYTTTQEPQTTVPNWLYNLDNSQNHISDFDNEEETATEDPSTDDCREPLLCNNSFQTYCPDKRCDGEFNCPDGDDELNCQSNIDVATPIECENNMFQCDHTRCVLLEAKCNGIQDCDDGKDEENCKNLESCSADDFKCDNGKCITASQKCNKVFDCANQEDELNCECSDNEFRCVNDGSCIELRKKCDGYAHCSDGSDEESCITCSLNQWQCDHGTCIKRTKRCDGRVDCPTDRSDERNCLASGYFRCRSGKYIPEKLRCNRQYDCPAGDYSDEKNCPCGEGDFKCNNGYCIPSSKHCDRTNDCQDGSDERNCKYERICMASEYKCSNGECVQADGRCNGSKECADGSDELYCPCKRDEFRCRDGSCINIALRCDGSINCLPHGEDEGNCGAPKCTGNTVQCRNGNCGERCNGIRECDDGEDEEACDDGCQHRCDGRCIEDKRICNNIRDCRDGSDEDQCYNCDGPNDFRCRNGDCIKDTLRCNGLSDCSDNSDEEACEQIVTPVIEDCYENQYQCRNGDCIDKQFYCDRQPDCTDESDEENCLRYALRPYQSPLKSRGDAVECHESEFTCYDGRCIPHLRRCDNIYDCLDFSDEQNCQNSACRYDEFQCASGMCISTNKYCNGIQDCDDNSDEAVCASPTTTYRYEVQPSTPGYGVKTKPFTTTGLPYVPPSDGCDRNEWRCENGPCISNTRRCDGHVDCPYDDSDELDCPEDSPAALKLKTYPNEQTVRYSGDVVFQCRDEGPERAPVRWIREGGRPLKPGATDIRGRLEIFRVTPSDSGIYICQAPKYLNYPGSELKVLLTVDTQPPNAVNSYAFAACKPDEATCANGQCIKKSSVCDYNNDCKDGSDETECSYRNGLCEPNQFRCANHRCVLRNWLCDSEDDCGDNSDEENCGGGTLAPGQICLPTEFSCHTGGQCIPRSFHCDSHIDCFDKSDELGCAKVSIRKPPQPQNVRLQPGDTLSLTCEALGVPTPLISWRLNWGHIPSKCLSTSIDGVGMLTCPNIQPEDSGAYSCEAINNKGTAFAAPDSIVFVNRTSVCPPGYFNSEANAATECVRCFCFGESTQCKSADLFTYNMPTPLGEGGTRLLGVQSSYNGDIIIDSQPITDLFYYQPLRNGAMVTKLATYASRRSHPYITLPETYNGNQLTSYGGYIRYRLLPHSQRFSYDNNVPHIIIKGKYETLLYYEPQRNEKEKNINARLIPENWQKASPRGLLQATREDIMMALDNVELILLRSDRNGGGANITDFVMESAQDINVGLGAATLVEECQCPSGYEGLSCQKCASGYGRKKSGPWLGNCEREESPCPPGTYGDPNNGLGCQTCPCPLTNRENQFARTCSVGSNGRVVCDCMPGYEGPNCEVCAPGFRGNPLVPGDSCKPQPSDNCDPLGTVRVRLPDQCECKENVQGRYCNQCKDNSFFLSDDFRHGCAQCFCSGVTSQCSSSNYRRKTSTVLFNVPTIVEQVKVYNSTPVGLADAIRYNAPVETGLTPIFYNGEVTLGSFDRSRPTIYYWSLPISFAGDKVTSYGGYLHYTLRHVPPPGGRYSMNNAADVQLISENHLIFHYYGSFVPSSNGYLNASVKFLEKGWQRSDGKEVQRENLLLALADVKTILIKATYTTNTQLATIESASIETAEPNGDGPQALHVEHCVCPAGYLGTSCEDCAPGYTRKDSGLYLGLCQLCECNGHSEVCNPETGVCYDCADNTSGDNCEVCQPGYERDRYNNCVMSDQTSIRRCNCDSRGEERACEDGRCICKQNVEGDACDRCRPGSFSLTQNNPDGCIPCYCSGVTSDCHEGLHYTRVPIPAPIFGENYGGYTLMNLINLKSDNIINNQFVPVTNESELMYVFSYPPNEELYWSLPVFPGNRILSYGGNLSLTQRFNSGGISEEFVPGFDVVLVSDKLSIFWTNPHLLREGQSLSYKVPLTEDNWYIFNSNTQCSRNDFMNVLKNLRRVLVKATPFVLSSILSTSIADVSMDTAVDHFVGPPFKGIEVCMCPEGYIGTSCESCSSGYYKDQNDNCSPCNCNGHQCQLGANGEIICNCRPPYTGRDCSSVGLRMELNPTVHNDGDPNSPYRRVTISCKYNAPEPLTIQFYYEGKEIKPPMYYNASRLYRGSWTASHEWSIKLDKWSRGNIVECLTINQLGSVLGILTTNLLEPAGEQSTDNYSTRPPPPQSTVVVKITSPTIKIQDVGGSVNFTCQAQSRYSQSPPIVTWRKADGNLPLGRIYTDDRKGILFITNLQVSDSGRYICQANDGVSMEEASATLQVPGNQMTQPTVSIYPSYKEYYEGDRIQLECTATGIPIPRITWQRAATRALPISAEKLESFFIIDKATEEDSGEYRCIATNQAGSTDRTAIITVRPRPSRPSRERLTTSQQAVNVSEGQSTKIVCTGSANIPSGSIGWIRQDGDLLLSNVQSDNGVLYIDGARLENIGIYVCQSTSSDASPVSVILTVLPKGTPPPSEASSVSVLQERIKIPTGGSTVIECIPSGYPLPLIKWKKHQSELGPGVSQRDNSLVINNAREDDQGYYVCEGTISNNILVSNVYVFVEIERREPPVVEIWRQGEQYVPLGSVFELRCLIKAGIPEPDVTWDRSGARPLSPHVQILPQNILRFEKVEVNDEGEYSCTARNDAGTTSASAVLKVRSPPEIVISPNNNLYVVNGDSIDLECRASGYPEPLVSIRKDSPDVREVIPQTPGMAALRVSHASNHDDGSYTCIATSAAGTFEEQFLINVDRGDGGFSDNGSGDDFYTGPEPDDQDQSRPANLIATEGQDSKITCDVDSDEYEVVWRRENGNRLQSNARQIGRELIIMGTSKADAGYYECILKNRYNGEATHRRYTALQVKRPPKITLRPPTQTVLPGQSPTVECDVDGDDILEVSWKPVNRPFSSRVEARHSTLIFHQIEVEDAGQYMCFAKNSVANATAVAEVKVNEELSRPPLESHDNEQFAHVGAGVHLSCNMTGQGLRTRWTKDGRSPPRSVNQKKDGSLFINRAQKSDSGHYVCIIQDLYGRQTVNYINLHIEGSQAEIPSLVTIEKPRRPFRVGENVDVHCKTSSRDTKITWNRLGTNQFVKTMTYGGGSVLLIAGVQESDAGVYQCIGRDLYGRQTSDEFNLEVTPGSNGISYPDNEKDEEYSARLQSTVELPCKHNLDEPVSIEWRKEFVALSPEIKANERILHLERITESDAGTYICRVSNSRAATEARAILRVLGVVPSFNGNSWLSLPKLKDAYRQFKIEISLKPTGDMNGLIFYNSQNQGREGDFISLQLVEGVPQFTLETGSGPITVKGDHPLQLNTWHTIRINWIENKVTMDVDNTGPFKELSDVSSVLDLAQPFYVGGVPDYDQLPSWLAGVSPFIGCVSMLILGPEEKNIIVDSLEQYNVQECETCSPSHCHNNGVCQGARNENGYICLCPAGFAGQDCSRTGEACRPDLCGPGKCTDTADGYTCACPVTYTGKRCEVQRSIEYPAFTGNAFLAVSIKRQARRFFQISMKVKASSSPIPDGIIMYCAESPRGYGGFTSLAVRNGRLEFRYDLGDGAGPVVLTSNTPLQVNEWSDVHLSRVAQLISMTVNTETVNGTVSSARNELVLDTPLYVGGYDDSIVLNNNTGVRGGFSGCIKDVFVFRNAIDIINNSIKSANIQECSDYRDRGDIPENEIKEISCISERCHNGGYCRSSDAHACTCQNGYTGQYCENRASFTPRDPCLLNPCVNGGTCKRDLTKRLNYSCDCPLGFAGSTCHMHLDLLQTVGFNSNGYLELPGRLLYYDNLVEDPAIIALAVATTADGVLLYQREVSSSPGYGSYILLRIESGKVILEWNFGEGVNTLAVDEVMVSDGNRHPIIARFSQDNSAYLSVDNVEKTSFSNGYSKPDSNIYIGGIPDYLNVNRYPGFNGCFDSVELMNIRRSLNLGEVAVAARNTQRCRDDYVRPREDRN